MSRSSSCDRFTQRLHEVLDEHMPLTALASDPHLLTCAACQAEYELTQAFSRPGPVPLLPESFTSDVLNTWQTAQRNSLRQRRVLAISTLALAASVLIAILALPSPEPRPVLPHTTVQRPIEETRQALVSLTTTVADETIAPVRKLTDVRRSSSGAASVESPLADFPEAAKAGFEPIVNTPRRALNLLIRDLGSAAGRKTNS